MSAKNTNTTKKYKKGDMISLYLKQKVSPELLNWINNQTDLSPSILFILEKYVKGELINADVLKNIGGLQLGNFQGTVNQAAISSQEEKGYSSTVANKQLEYKENIETEVEEAGNSVSDELILTNMEHNKNSDINTSKEDVGVELESTNSVPTETATVKEVVRKNKVELTDNTTQVEKKKVVLSNGPIFSVQNEVKSIFTDDE